jgi:hypothetical protein
MTNKEGDGTFSIASLCNEQPTERERKRERERPDEFELVARTACGGCG